MELFMCKECAHEISRAPTANQAVTVNRNNTCEKCKSTIAAAKASYEASYAADAAEAAAKASYEASYAADAAEAAAKASESLSLEEQAKIVEAQPFQDDWELGQHLNKGD